MALALRPPPGRDPLVRMIVLNWALGAALGLACAAVVLAADVAGLRSLMARGDLALPALALLFGGFAITFGGVVAASAVMLTPRDGDDGDDRGHGAFTPALRPALVRARAPVRRLPR
ncbi:MAG TPA: hypothetical protein VIL72_00380 [Beijerinckiaceae bacterium]|jgi:hypothetical protein